MNRTLIALTLVVLVGLTFAPAAEARPLPEPTCMQVYNEYDFGAVRIVSPNSCTVHVWVLGYQIR